jgi:hypothetical protein
MGALVRNCDRIREETGAHVMLVHHTGKDTAKGARGHSLLRAATDTEIEVKRESGSEIITAKVTKQRDGEIGKMFAFCLETVKLDVDPDGDPITSCVVVPEDAEAFGKDQNRGVTGQSKIALDILRDAIIRAGEPARTSEHIPRTAKVIRFEEWRRLCYESQITDSDKPDAKQKAFVRAARALQTKKLIGKYGDFVWPVD